MTPSEKNARADALEAEAQALRKEAQQEWRLALHQGEIVFPADIAERLRQALLARVEARPQR